MEASEKEDSEISIGTFVDLVRTNASQKKCIVCNRKRCKKNNKLKRISDKSVVDAYIKTSILIPFGCRACKYHLDAYGILKQDSLGNINFNTILHLM